MANDKRIRDTNNDGVWEAWISMGILFGANITMILSGILYLQTIGIVLLILQLIVITAVLLLQI